MWLRSEDFQDGAPIPQRFAMGKHHADDNATFADNLNPHLSWGDVPAGTKSLVLIMTDTQAPSVGDDVNQPDRVVPHGLPRAHFHHWVLIDIDPAIDEIPAGSHSREVVAGGKSAQSAAGSLGAGRHGLNSYTQWFAADPDMAGDYFGYDGPFPPWNDERTHEYEFTLYALDGAWEAEEASLPKAFTAADVLSAMRGHVLDSATLTGTYRINPN